MHSHQADQPPKSCGYSSNSCSSAFLLFLPLSCHLSLPLHRPHHFPTPRSAPSPPQESLLGMQRKYGLLSTRLLTDPTEEARLTFRGPSMSPSAMRSHFSEAQKWANCLMHAMPSSRHGEYLPHTIWTNKYTIEHDRNPRDETQTTPDIRITSLEAWPHPHRNIAFNSAVCDGAWHSSHRVPSYFQCKL